MRALSEGEDPVPRRVQSTATGRQEEATRHHQQQPWPTGDSRLNVKTTACQGIGMFVFEIITPGTWLDYDDRDWSWRIQNQLQSLESQFFEANAALNLFVNAQSIRPSFADQDTWERDAQRRSEIGRAVEQERGDPISREQLDEIHFESDVRFKREKWSNGGVPREFEHNLPFIYARVFLYALDAFDKFLGVLSKEPNVPEQVARFYAQVAEEFPHLRGVRNTAQHLA